MVLKKPLILLDMPSTYFTISLKHKLKASSAKKILSGTVSIGLLKMHSKH